MKPREIRVTPGFNLNMDIIHVLAPKYYEARNPIDELLFTYKKMLEVILEKGYKKSTANKCENAEQENQNGRQNIDFKEKNPIVDRSTNDTKDILNR